MSSDSNAVKSSIYEIALNNSDDLIVRFEKKKASSLKLTMQ